MAGRGGAEQAARFKQYDYAAVSAFRRGGSSPQRHDLAGTALQPLQQPGPRWLSYACWGAA